MRKIRLFVCGCAVAALLGLAACSTIFSQEQSLPPWHPEELKEHHVQCSECHENVIKGVMKDYETFNHSSEFIKRHRYFAYQNTHLCNTCHEGKFCVDCHATKGAVSPIDRAGTGDDIEFNHRGDYLTRHQTDGKLDPANCYRCHGRTNNESCRRCHRERSR